MGTFHSICLKILKREIEALGYNKNFLIYDYNDQVSLVRSVMNDLDISTKQYNPKGMLEKISRMKSSLISHDEFSQNAKNHKEKLLSAIYDDYQASLAKNNALDFDDLIMLTVTLFKKHPEILAKYQNFFKYILVDEYQDTNHSQYKLINLLAGKHRNLFVIGDDFQSIYKWREADIKNILDFEKDYPEAKVIMLEQNYRSTKNIINAANSVIANNPNQKHKNLWTENDHGQVIEAKELYDQRQEANFIVQKVSKFSSQNRDLNDLTILYRTHAQSRTLEEEFIKRGIPYRIIGGIRFYERREIKDVLAYLRLAYNPSDSVSFDRVYNTPERGLGKITYEKLKKSIFQSGSTVKGLRSAIDDHGFSGQRAQSISKLANFLESIHEKSSELALSELVTYILKSVDYKSYIDDGTEEGKERWKNVKEIFTATKKYDPPAIENAQALRLRSGQVGLVNFLEEVALIQETDKILDNSQAVNLMTFHAVKGLEFPIVFMAGMEDGVFPHSQSLFNQEELEEERRLCYVGITRAKEELYITFCRQRMLHGSTQFNPPSRFLFEIPENNINFSTIEDGESGYKLYY